MAQETIAEKQEDIQQEAKTHKAAALYESFFGNGTEEEQLRLSELAGKLGVRDNDAIWIIIYVLNYFGRFYRDLPAKLKESSNICLEDVRKAAAEISEAEVRKAQALFSETLTKSTQELLDQYKKKTWLYDMFLPLAWACAGVFGLCLLSFVGGAAIVGKGWGQSPMPALLNAPAGWILPLAFIPVAGFAIYRGFMEFDRKRYLYFAAAGLIIILAFGALGYVL